MTEFDPKTLEITQSGATAALILDAVKVFSGECVELVLLKIDDHVRSSILTPELAVSFCSEIAAYRRIVQRIKTKAQQGAKMREYNERAPTPSA